MLHRHFCCISGFNFLTFHTKVFHTCPNKRTRKHHVTEELFRQRMPLIYHWCKIEVASVYIQLVQDGPKHNTEAAFLTCWNELHPSPWLLLYLPYRKMQAIPIQKWQGQTGQSRNAWIFGFELWALQVSSDFGKYTQLSAMHSLTGIW